MFKSTVASAVSFTVSFGIIQASLAEYEYEANQRRLASYEVLDGM